MQKGNEIKKVVQICQNEMVKELLPELEKDLELCLKSLDVYLETKRKKFPRLYFVSDSTLLKILS